MDQTEQPIQPQVFRYQPPARDERATKHLVRLARTDRQFSAVQIVKEGGENNLHSHAHMDGFWFVLGGRVRFYGGEDNVVIAELGKHEGILVPRGYPYWFESAGDEDLELLQIESADIPILSNEQLMADRKNYTQPTTTFGKSTYSNGRIELEQARPATA